MRHAFEFDGRRRASGLLLHPTSLPGPHFSGDLGAAAYRFVDFLLSARQTCWQMLPVSPPGAPPGNSPYSSYSAFAGSPWLISLENLFEQGLLDRHDIADSSLAVSRSRRCERETASDFEASRAYRLPRLRKAFERFESLRGSLRESFDRFCRSNRSWLDDDALFSALKAAHQGAQWSKWNPRLRLRKADALRVARKELAREIQFHQFLQFEFDRQWLALRRYANERGVGLVGDLPIFVAYDSADVWAHRELFLLDRSGRPSVKSGYPPDCFSRDGQTWGHPHYDWPTHQKSGFGWWIARFESMYRWFDATRIDHFLGFDRTWHIPGNAKNARRGKWAPSPGDKIFAALRRALGPLPIIAEDLGQLTPQAAALRDRFGFPGMRVMQFGFGPGGDYHLPHRYVSQCVAYTGTHDNQTIVGWFERLRSFTRNGRATSVSRAEYRKVVDYLDCSSEQIHWAAIRSLMSSVAATVIFPAQDVLGLSDEARMNVPGRAEGNWDWRLRAGQLTDDHASRLAELCELYDRLPAAPNVKTPSRKPLSRSRSKDVDRNGHQETSRIRQVSSASRRAV